MTGIWYSSKCKTLWNFQWCSMLSVIRRLLDIQSNPLNTTPRRTPYTGTRKMSLLLKYIYCLDPVWEQGFDPPQTCFLYIHTGAVTRITNKIKLMFLNGETLCETHSLDSPLIGLIPMYKVMIQETNLHGGWELAKTIIGYRVWRHTLIKIHHTWM